MTSTEDLPLPEDGKISDCIVPQKFVCSDGQLTKATCQDPVHDDEDKIREGANVYAIISQENDSTEILSLACIDCSVQSIYERISKDNDFLIVKGVLKPELEHGDNELLLTNIVVLDSFKSVH